MIVLPRTLARCAASIGIVAAALYSSPAWTDDSIWARPALFDVPDGPKADLKERGVDVGLSLTQFEQALIDSGEASQYGGKLDLFVNFDGQKLGLWRGLSVATHVEYNYGDNANGLGTGLRIMPVNTALTLPTAGGSDGDLSILVTQAFDTTKSVTLGKFNMLDAVSKTPLVGGGGIGTFMNLAMAAPLTGITPPYVLGGMFTLKTNPATFALFVYDPRNAQDSDVLHDPFSDGVTTSLSTTVPVKVAGLSGYQGLRAAYSTQDGFDLRDLPELALPPGARDLSGNGHRWYVQYSFQQFLHQEDGDATSGWGLFGQAALSDGNPNFANGHAFIGVGGTSPLRARSMDRFGIGYYRYRLSGDLRDSLDVLGVDLHDSQGLEAYYNLAVTPWVLLTVDVQVVQPFDTHTDVFVALRLQLKLL